MCQWLDLNAIYVAQYIFCDIPAGHVAIGIMFQHGCVASENNAHLLTEPDMFSLLQ
jgi:hypothetical protein